MHAQQQRRKAALKKKNAIIHNRDVRFLILPVEILLHVVRFLSKVDKRKLRCVCKKMHEIVSKCLKFSLKISASDDKRNEKLSVLSKIAFEEVIFGSFTSSNSWLRKSHFELLSSHLRKLMVLQSINFLSDWLKVLPNSLTDLTFCGRSLTDSDISLLPKNLISLELSCNPDLTDEGVKKISASITRLDVSFCAKVKDASSFGRLTSLQQLFACDTGIQRIDNDLPNSLTFLETGAVLLEKLPKNLETLALRTIHTKTTLITSPPVSLRRLDIYNLTEINYILSNLLQLTRLTELGMAQLTKESYSFIPASLKVLYTQPNRTNDIHPFFTVRDYTDWTYKD